MVKIDSVSFGEISIDGKVYYSDMIIWWDGSSDFVIKDHRFGISGLARIIKKHPEAIVIGTGQQGMLEVLPEVKSACKDADIKLYTDPTPKAVEFFNGLIAQGRKAAGFFHVTC